MNRQSSARGWAKPSGGVFLFNIGPEAIAMMSGITLYAAIFFTPFFQEDVAVIGAAAASLAGAGSTPLIVIAIMCGLVASDGWKYWIGGLARRHQWAHKFAEKPGVSVAGDLINKEFMQTMLTARFVPGTRIPTYVAAGFFRAPYGKYMVTLVFTAALYVGLMFGLFHSVGAVAGEQAKIWLPALAITLLVVYILYRWISHRRQKKGPMTPLSDEPDHPLPEAEKKPANPTGLPQSEQRAMLAERDWSDG